MSQPITSIADFYKIVDSVIDLNGEVFDILQRDFIQKYPEVRIVHCDNDMFSNSLIIIIPYGNRVAVFYLDQFEKGCIRINFSEERFNIFQEKLLSVKV